ncbi:MAG: hypothetical protein OEY28_05900, partial [Nitrospira sp.]|nr:hypothetical protein [Nitrospira sp.]
MTRIVAICALCICCSGLAAGRQLDITAIEVDSTLRRQVESRVEDAFAGIAKATGLVDDRELHLVLVGDSDQFASLAKSDGVSLRAENVLGYAEPGARRVVLNLAGIAARGVSPEGVLRHEIAHIVMGSALVADRPLWFEEGICQWLEATPIDAIRESAPGVLPDPSYDSLGDLSKELRGSNAGLAYVEARRVIQFMVNRHGAKKLRAMLGGMALTPTPFSDAFVGATGESVAEFEAAWLEDFKVRRKGRFVEWLGANWWWLLFGSAAVLSFSLFLRKRRKRLSLVEMWEEQERHFPSDPEWSYFEDEDE